MKVHRARGRDGEFHGYMVFCPGCEHAHVYDKRWTFNGDYDKPTFTPSYLAKGSPGEEQRVCHSFLTDGKFRFLNDCTHKYKGQTVDVPDLWDGEDED